MHPDATTVLEFYFLEQAIPDMQRELPTYLAEGELEWWDKQEELPLAGQPLRKIKFFSERLARETTHWAAACQQILLCQPSSTAVERVFSVPRSSFGDDQSSSLEDYH